MLTKFNSGGVILAALLAMSSCQNENLVDNPSPQGNQITLTASRGVESRTQLGDPITDDAGKKTLPLCWSAGDQIYVSDESGEISGKLSIDPDDIGKTEATFTGFVSGDPSKLVYSVYPVPSEDGEVELKSFEGKEVKIPMVGRISEKNVQFDSTCGLMVVEGLSTDEETTTSFEFYAGTASSSEYLINLAATAKIARDENGNLAKNEDGKFYLEYEPIEDVKYIDLNNAEFIEGKLYIPYDLQSNAGAEKNIHFYIKSDNKTELEQITTTPVNLKDVSIGKPLYAGAKILVNEDGTAISVPSKEITSDNTTSTSATVEFESSEKAINVTSVPANVTDVKIGMPINLESNTTEATVAIGEIQNKEATVTIGATSSSTSGSGEIESNIKEMTVILPSNNTSDNTESKDLGTLVIDMPNTTVTVKPEAGNTLYIEKLEAATADNTLIVKENVKVGTLSVLKGGIQVHGHIKQLKRAENNEDEVTYVTIEKGGSIVEIIGDGFCVVDKNQVVDFAMLADGTYIINTAKGLKNFASMVNDGETFAGKTIKLGASIDLNNELWTPIGLDGIYFAGTLDGQNYYIKNLKIENSIGMFTGLFARVKGATFKNIRLSGGEVKGSDGDQMYYVGALMGYGDGVNVINCHNEGCNVIHINERGYSGGLVGSVNKLDGVNSNFIACSNSAEVCGVYCPSGITGGGFAASTNIVACFNTGKISYSGSESSDLSIYAAGISGNFSGAGQNFMYGCFTDCEIVEGSNHGALIADGGTSYGGFYYSYSANTEVSLIGQIWGTANNTIGYSSYRDAVENLNKGIQLYNWSATVPCEYTFAEGDTPKLVYTKVDVSQGGISNNFGNGGKF